VLINIAPYSDHETYVV